jgi:hypothetical protein
MRHRWRQWAHKQDHNGVIMLRILQFPRWMRTSEQMAIMTRNPQEHDAEAQAKDLLQSGATAELHLLKQERRAERRLAKARATLAEDQHQLERAQHRVAQSQRAVAEAEDALRQCQLRRAAGPSQPEA